MPDRLIVILGPTGIGKSNMAIDIAEQLGTEIISSDSRQFYHEMSIGTAVPSESDLKRIKHHFIRHISVESYYSASLFENDAIARLQELFKLHRDVIMAGGSGLYIDAVCGSIDEIPDVDPEVRKKYLDIFAADGIDPLRSELKLVDPDYYAQTDIRNHKRLLRALEIYWTTGKPYSSYLLNKGKTRDFEIVRIGLNMDREELYHRIEERVDAMMEAGLEEEARSVAHLKNLNALNTVGYRELFNYFDGEISRDKAIELIKRNSRRYAKRQITWWARDKDINWFGPEDREGILNYLR
jgi:tRNA dimethylallyltransferase